MLDRTYKATLLLRIYPAASPSATMALLVLSHDLPVAHRLHGVDTRGTAVGVGWGLNRLVSGMVALIFPIMKSSIGDGGTFFFFAIISVVALVFVHLAVPETKGVYPSLPYPFL